MSGSEMVIYSLLITHYLLLITYYPRIPTFQCWGGCQKVKISERTVTRKKDEHRCLKRGASVSSC